VSKSEVTYTWDPVTNRCISSTTTDVKKCPEGEEEDSLHACCRKENMNPTARVCCPVGQSWNEGAKACVCPAGQTWTGTACGCPSGQTWDEAMKLCKGTCLPPMRMISGVCCPDSAVGVKDGRCDCGAGRVVWRDQCVDCNCCPKPEILNAPYDASLKKCKLASTELPPASWTVSKLIQTKNTSSTGSTVCTWPRGTGPLMCSRDAFYYQHAIGGQNNNRIFGNPRCPEGVWVCGDPKCGPGVPCCYTKERYLWMQHESPNRCVYDMTRIPEKFKPVMAGGTFTLEPLCPGQGALLEGTTCQGTAVDGSGTGSGGTRGGQ